MARQGGWRRRRRLDRRQGGWRRWAHDAESPDRRSRQAAPRAMPRRRAWRRGRGDGGPRAAEGGQAVERRARYEPTEGCLVPIGLCNLWATVCQRNVCFLVILRRRVCVISQCGIALPVRTGVLSWYDFLLRRASIPNATAPVTLADTRDPGHVTHGHARHDAAYALLEHTSLSAYTLQRYAAMHARSLSDAPYHPISRRSSRAVRSDPQKLGTGQPLLWTHATHPNQR